jgi:hypothetical protein
MENIKLLGAEEKLASLNSSVLYRAVPSVGRKN